MKITAVGDVALQRKMPGEYAGLAEVRQFISKGDVRFFNLETTVNKDCFGAFFSGGTWLRTDPEVLSTLKPFGFNMATTANNHATDFAYEGLVQTMKYVGEEGYVFSGTGRNLSEAAAPAYLDLPEGRVALISVTDTFSPGAMAGEQSRRLPGRPGVNGLRITETVCVGQEDMERIKVVAKNTGVNNASDIIRAEGYLPPLAEGTFDFGTIHFSVSDTPGIRHEIAEADLERVDRAIYEASLTADLILISVHSHKVVTTKDATPTFLQAFCRRCIDKGAHAVLGHGPHLLRGMEMYKGKPIFYSLGDFLLELESGPYAPEDFYAKFGLTSDDTMHTLFKTRSRNFTVGLQRERVMLETVIPCITVEKGVVKEIEIMPVRLADTGAKVINGLPQKAEDTSILERLRDLSVPFGTEIEIRDGMGYVKL